MSKCSKGSPKCPKTKMSGPDSYPEIGSWDRRHLIEDNEDEGRSRGCSGFARRHKRCLMVFSVLTMIAICHIVAVYFIYFRCNAYNNCSTIKYVEEKISLILREQCRIHVTQKPISNGPSKQRLNSCFTRSRVMALNTWGMPRTFGSEYKEERMVSIADELSKGHYDIYLFEELWMQPDHTTVAAKVRIKVDI